MQIKVRTRLFQILVFTTVLSSCLFKTNEDSTEGFNVKILIRSPGNCVEMLLLKENGHDFAVRGISESDYRNNFTRFTKVEVAKSFIIKSETDLQEINTLVHEIESSKVQKGTFILDTRRMQIYIKSKLKMDIYSVSTTQLDQIVYKLAEYTPFSITDACSGDGIKL